MNEEIMKFLIWFTGHDEETIKQVYNDWLASPKKDEERKDKKAMEKTDMTEESK